MQDIPRAILLPPPNPPLRANARGAAALDRDLPEDPERGARRVSGDAAARFLALIDVGPEDTIDLQADLKGKQFRFRPYGRTGAAERDEAEKVIERPAGGETQSAPESGNLEAAAQVLEGFANGPQSRNSAAFLASYIAQEQLSDGLHNPPHAAASESYRRQGGAPVLYSAEPRVVRIAA